MFCFKLLKRNTCSLLLKWHIERHRTQERARDTVISITRQFSASGLLRRLFNKCRAFNQFLTHHKYKTRIRYYCLLFLLFVSCQCLILLCLNCTHGHYSFMLAFFLLYCTSSTAAHTNIVLWLWGRVDNVDHLGLGREKGKDDSKE